MTRRFFPRLFCIIIFFALCIVSLYCVERYNHYILNSITNSWGGETGSGSITYDYVYSENNPELLVSTTYGTDKYCVGTVTLLDDHRHFEYYVYANPEHTSPLFYFIYEIDSQGRIFHDKRVDWNPTGHLFNDFVFEVYRHYNTAGCVDSLDYKIEYTRRHVKRYFTDNRLSSSVVKRLNAGIWIPEIRRTYVYGDNPVEYDYYLRFDNFEASMFEELTSLEALVNPKMEPDSTITESWNGNTWGAPITTEYPIVNHVYYVDGSWSLNHWTFAQTGNLVSKYSWYIEGSSSTSYNWGTVTHATDESISALTNKLSVNPNPFTDEVRINWETGKVTLPTVQIFNIKGQLVRSWKYVRSNELVWNGTDRHDQKVSPGVYLVRLSNEGDEFWQKLILLR